MKPGEDIPHQYPGDQFGQKQKGKENKQERKDRRGRYGRAFDRNECDIKEAAKDLVQGIKRHAHTLSGFSFMLHERRVKDNYKFIPPVAN